MRTFSNNGMLLPLNSRLALMNLSLSDSLMQELLSDLTIDENDEENL